MSLALNARITRRAANIGSISDRRGASYGISTRKRANKTRIGGDAWRRGSGSVTRRDLRVISATPICVVTEQTNGLGAQRMCGVTLRHL